MGRPFCSDADMEYAVEYFLQTMRDEGSREIRSKHVHPSGWYSSEVLATAVTTTSMRKPAGKVEYCMLLQPLHKSPSDIHSSVGAVVNLEAESHWIALRSVCRLASLESLRRAPI